jgi:hypothetical protein
MSISGENGASEYILFLDLKIFPRYQEINANVPRSIIKRHGRLQCALKSMADNTMGYSLSNRFPRSTLNMYGVGKIMKLWRAF